MPLKLGVSLEESCAEPGRGQQRGEAQVERTDADANGVERPCSLQVVNVGARDRLADGDLSIDSPPLARPCGSVRRTYVSVRRRSSHTSGECYNPGKVASIGRARAPGKRGGDRLDLLVRDYPFASRQ